MWTSRIYSPPPSSALCRAKGYLGIYRRNVQPMSTGAVLTDLGK